MLEDIFADLDMPTRFVKEKPILSEPPPIQLPAAALQDDSGTTEEGCSTSERCPLIDDEAEEVNEEVAEEVSEFDEDDCNKN